MGAPWVELPRDTIRHAYGVTHVVSLIKPTTTFHPRPILGSGFYATAFSISFWMRNPINRVEETKGCFGELSMTMGVRKKGDCHSEHIEESLLPGKV